MNQQLANKVSALCLQHFDGLKKTGKPKAGEEWTVLSAIVEMNERTGCLKVVAMGTGTKCLNGEQLSAGGDVINDGHAEVMARRAFLRYLLLSLTNQEIFTLIDGKFSTDPSISYHFFTTHAPCGDASIFEGDDEPSVKRKKLDPECVAGFTGAKLLAVNDQTDLMDQEKGQIRTKPGKGVRTLSVSCSDKMARWNVMGVQGAMLLTLLARPIYLASIVVCAGTSISVESLRRAIWQRWDYTQVKINPLFRANAPDIFVADNPNYFQFAKPSDATTLQPCSASISWFCAESNRPLEVSIAGRRQGVNKKNINSPNARLSIAKIELFQLYQEILVRHVDIHKSLYPDYLDSVNELRYSNVKTTSRDYHQQWEVIKEHCYKVWTTKPDGLLNFKTR